MSQWGYITLVALPFVVAYPAAPYQQVWLFVQPNTGNTSLSLGLRPAPGELPETSKADVAQGRSGMQHKAYSRCAVQAMCATSMPAVSTTEANQQPFPINFCNESQFTDANLRQYSLGRVSYFLFNSSCSQHFFQCANGYTYVLRCPTTQQAFDPIAQSCNYRYNISFCEENKSSNSSSSLSGSCVNCAENQFACCTSGLPCIDRSRRCDGRMDCANGADEQNCPACTSEQFACMKSGNCIPASKHCNGIEDECGDGSNFDEYNCGSFELTRSISPPSLNISCVARYTCQGNAATAPKCVSYSRFCDGRRDCPLGDDEAECQKRK